MRTKINVGQTDDAIATDIELLTALSVHSTDVNAHPLYVQINNAVTTVNTRKGDITLAKEDVGLSEVDNTSDINKPLSTAAISSLGNKVNVNLLGTPDGVATLDSNAKLNTTQIPALTKTMVGLDNVDNTTDLNKPVSTAQNSAIIVARDAAIAASTPISHIGSGGTSHVAVTTSTAGFMSAADKVKLNAILGTNTGDETGASIKSKLGVATLSGSNTGDQVNITGNSGTATTLQTARTINGVSFNGSANITVNAVDATARIASTEKGAANGVATLDSSGIIPSNQLPSFVDDVLEYANLAALPIAGETGKIYVTLDTNKTYRWSGSTYIFITSGAVDSVNTKTGIVVLDKADIGLGNVDNTSDINKPIATAVQTALAGKVNTSALGVPNGIATLDANGRLLFSQLPNRIFVTTIGAFSGNSSIPGDNSTPLITEGSLLISKEMGPENVTSGLIIGGNLMIDCINSNRNLVLACFKDTTCIGSMIINFVSANRPMIFTYDFYDPVFGAGGPATYSLRIGSTSSTTWYVNRLASQVLNGTMSLNRPIHFEEVNV